MSKPYKCPVCEGSGKVYLGFYQGVSPSWNTSQTTPSLETCKSCHGSGIVWEYVNINYKIDDVKMKKGELDDFGMIVAVIDE
jgi:DnaJ-class molecular chaperone